MAFGQRNKCSKGIKNKAADNNMQKTLKRFFAWDRCRAYKERRN